MVFSIVVFLTIYELSFWIFLVLSVFSLARGDFLTTGERVFLTCGEVIPIFSQPRSLRAFFRIKMSVRILSGSFPLATGNCKIPRRRVTFSVNCH